jgi:hypothetical protein
MRKLLFVALLVSPIPAMAQSLITVTPQQCVWRAGDELAWAAPNLDETGWQPYTSWTINSKHPRIWIRCHTDLSYLRHVDQPSVQISLYAAYQIFEDGRSMGAALADTAQNFGQQDDITVLTITFAPVALHA